MTTPEPTPASGPAPDPTTAGLPTVPWSVPPAALAAPVSGLNLAGGADATLRDQLAPTGDTVLAFLRHLG